ncbi:MAG: ribosome maturation factor RimM [Bryobacteraceae bacterium]
MPKPNLPAGGEWVILARVDRSRGRAGEVLASGFARPAEWYQGRRVTLLPSAAAHTIENAWIHDDRLVLKFAGVDSIGAAEMLRGQEVAMPKSEREPLGEGEYYYADLVGCELFDDESGQSRGVVGSWYETGGPVLLEAGALLVPFVPAICVRIDLDAKRIFVRLPEGLEGLNAQ